MLQNCLFIKTCLESDSPIISTIARYGIYYGCINSHLGLNAFFLLPKLWCHWYSVDVLQLLFVREGVLSCPLLKVDDIDIFVDFTCISWCKYIIIIIIIISPRGKYIYFVNTLISFQHKCMTSGIKPPIPKTNPIHPDILENRKTDTGAQLVP